MADRAYIADENRDYINTHGNILDLEATPNKEIFFLTMALGMDVLKKLPTKKTGWILFKTFDTRDQALIQALRLGAEDVNEENINDFTDFDKCIDYAEQCSEAGLPGCFYTSSIARPRCCWELSRAKKQPFFPPKMQTPRRKLHPPFQPPSPTASEKPVRRRSMSPFTG